MSLVEEAVLCILTEACATNDVASLQEVLSAHDAVQAQLRFEGDGGASCKHPLHDRALAQTSGDELSFARTGAYLFFLRAMF